MSRWQTDLVVVSHHPVTSTSGVVVSMRAMIETLGSNAFWASSTDPSPKGLNAELVCFNGGFSLEFDAAAELLAVRTARGQRSAIYWHEAGISLRRLQGLATIGSETDSARQLRWQQLAPIVTSPSVVHLAASSTVKVSLVALLGLDPRSVHLVYEAIAPVSQGPTRRPSIEEHIRICSAGTSDPRKNLDGFSSLAATRQIGALPAIWTWYGSIPSATNDDNLILPGFVQPLANALATQDLYLCLSTDEPFSIAALEALAAGLPVICLESTGIAEILPPSWIVHCEGEVPSRIEYLIDGSWPTTSMCMGLVKRFTAKALIERFDKAFAHDRVASQ